MRIKALPFIVVSIVLLFSCDVGRYSLEQGKDGRLYRVDKKTGKVAVLEGDKVINLTTPEEQEREKSSLEALSAPKKWKTIYLKMLGDVTLTLRTSWRENKMYYIFDITPYTERLKKNRESNYSSLTSFTINMEDLAGFNLLKIKIPLLSMNSIVDRSNKVIGLTINSETDCSIEKYKDFTNWDVEWHLKY